MVDLRGQAGLSYAFVAEGSVEELTARSGARDLEAVFMSLTGRRIEEADREVEVPA